MCGIVGFYSLEQFERLSSCIESATQTLYRRGPDDSGLFLSASDGIGLGHRRLSIIDLSEAGHQPMVSPDGKCTIVFNGEIYNFLKIREELQRKGYRFNSHSDTEVILNAYRQWGLACLDRFVGMFAFAIWDKDLKQLIMVRDRIGIKPLFYYYNNRTLVFGSDLKALMAFDLIEKEVDPDALPLFFHYQYIPAPKTIFKRTHKLEPGNYLIFNGKEIKIERYWQLPLPLQSEDTALLTEDQWIERLDRTITQAVSDRLISDVPLGALLSGGIDSSLVVSMMQKVNPSPVRTFSIGFGEQQYNEAPWASKIADYLGTDHTELYVDSKRALDIIPQLPEFYDEPFADSSAIPTFLVSQLTRSMVTVALTGDGGDEQFAGYVRYWMTRTMADLLYRFPKKFKSICSRMLQRLPPSLIENFYMPVRDHLPQRFRIANFLDKWQKLLFLLDKQELSEIYRMTICIWSDAEIELLVGKPLPESRYDAVFTSTGDLSAISRLLLVDQSTYLPDAMLTKVDRASMAASLEVRVPLLDHRVVELTARLPEALKYRNGSGKYVLKRLLARYIPTALFERPKMGFGLPIDQWFRSDLKELLLDYLSPARLDREGRLNSGFIVEKIKEHLDGKCNHHYRLWAILMWEMWRERWLS